VSTIDLSQVPAPNVVEALSFEAIFAAMLAQLRALDSAFTALVESDPAYKILQVCAYRELALRQRVNDAAHANMLAYATNSNLDQIGANYGVQRLTITPANTSTAPPTPAVMESDADFRRRILLSRDSYTTAGSRDSYRYHALSASGDVKDVAINSITPGQVNVAVLSRTSPSATPATTLAAVNAALSAEDVRPLCDSVAVQSAQPKAYSVSATLYFKPGAGQAEAIAMAEAALLDYQTNLSVGEDVPKSAIYKALHQAGVQRVELTQPADDVTAVQWHEIARASSVNITNGGVGE
jgi:phage-related baseplate assembly protein